MVDYATANGTAIAGSDYRATSGTLTIAAGQTSGTIAVQVIGDTAKEADETFYLNLSNAVNVSNPCDVVIVVGQGVGTIQNDDTRKGSAAAVSSPALADAAPAATNAYYAAAAMYAQTLWGRAADQFFDGFGRAERREPPLFELYELPA